MNFHRSSSLGVVWILLFLHGSAEGLAQQTAGGNFAILRQTPAYQNAVLAAAYKTAAWANSGCKGKTAALGQQITVHTMPVRVNPQLQTQSGAWIEHVTVAHCDRPRQLNVLFEVVAPGVNATVTMLPGTTHADLVLQKDATPFVLVAAAINPTGCKPVYIADTAYERAQAPSVAGKAAWMERWTVAQCEDRIAVDVVFTPDAAGTKISAHKAAQPI